MHHRTLVWFRGKDLRVSDHAPLVDAISMGEMIPVFVLDPFFFTPERAQHLPHRMQFLLDSLIELSETISTLGSTLIVVQGKSVDVIPRLAHMWNVTRVVAHRWSEPFGRERDQRIKQALGAMFVLYEGETLLPPGTLRTQAGKPYAVFSQFARAFVKQAQVKKPLSTPKSLALPSDITADIARIPSMNDLGMPINPQLIRGGESHARTRLKHFIKHALSQYADQRDRMDTPGTSRLSADLKFGTLSIRTLWHALTEEGPGTDAYRNELLWREFSHSTLWDHPEYLERPVQEKFVGFPWRDDEHAWNAWTQGTTGYPIVDAAAQQLLQEGFVHNRARMITASFLTKHLMLSYQQGEEHFMRYLVDGDWAQNNMGWQWSAGCGCDAQPYFRVFNPMTQGEKFDPDGIYVRTWVPVLAKMPSKWIHRPWEAPDLVLHQAGVRLGHNYPKPIVDHAKARERFLATAQKHLHRR